MSRFKLVTTDDKIVIIDSWKDELKESWLPCMGLTAEKRCDDFNQINEEMNSGLSFAKNIPPNILRSLDEEWAVMTSVPENMDGEVSGLNVERSELLTTLDRCVNGLPGIIRKELVVTYQLYQKAGHANETE